MAGPDSGQDSGQDNGHQLVVVGTDGSEQARAAVRWAADHAACTGARLRVVHAVVLSTMGGVAWHAEAAVQAERLVRALEEDGHRQVGRARGEVERHHPGLPVETAVVTGDPRTVLLAEAAGAALLVVGSRGRGPLAGLLLGSVSGALAGRAPCPTVVHREPAPDARGVLTCTEPAAVALATSWATAHGTTVEETAEPDADALVAASRGRELLVVARRDHHRGPAVLDHAVTVAEHAACPVAVVAVTPVATGSGVVPATTAGAQA